MKCFADLDVNVSNNIECIDFWHLIQVMSVGEFSVIGLSFPHSVFVSFKRSENIFSIDELQKYQKIIEPCQDRLKDCDTFQVNAMKV